MRTSFFSCLSALAAVALGSPVIQERDIPAGKLADFKFFAQYAGATYCNSYNEPGQKVACTSGVCPEIEANNVTTISSFGGPITDHRGFIAVDHTRGLIVVALRGTVSVRNWIVEAANPKYKIVVTGHSLGGATATIAAAYLRKSGYPVDIYTFGSPRVGNSNFAKFVTSQAGEEYRVTHGNDPIARLPPIVFNFRHTSPEYWLQSYEPTTADVQLCTGHTNVKCNGGTMGFSLDPHGWYFFQINGCATGQTPWRRDSAEMTDSAIEAMLNKWVEQDIKFTGPE